MAKARGTHSNALHLLHWGFTSIGAAFTLALAAMLVLAAYSGHLNPLEHRGVFVVLCLAFPYILFVNVLVAVFWLVLRKWIVAAIAVAGILLSWPSVWTVFPLNVFPSSPNKESHVIKVMTYNVRYFVYDNEKSLLEHNYLLDFVYDKDPDVVLLQESIDIPYESMKSMTKADLDTLYKHYPYRSETNNSDPSILSKYPFKMVKTKHTKKNGYHPVMQTYEVDIEGHKINFVNVHLQSIHLSEEDKTLFWNYMNKENINNLQLAREVKSSIFSKIVEASRIRATQAEEVRDMLNTLKGPVILCGDLNDTPSSWPYRTIRGDDMRDAYCDCAFGHTITYHENRFYFRLDHIFYNADELKAIDIERGNEKLSDHYPLIATFEWRHPNN